MIMWSKIKTAFYTSLVFITGILSFIGGILFYSEVLDKPEVTNETNVDIEKVKSKDGNVSVTIPVSEKPNIPAIKSNVQDLEKRKWWQIFKKKIK